MSPLPGLTTHAGRNEQTFDQFLKFGDVSYSVEENVVLFFGLESRFDLEIEVAPRHTRSVLGPFKTVRFDLRRFCARFE